MRVGFIAIFIPIFLKSQENLNIGWCELMIAKENLIVGKRENQILFPNNQIRLHKMIFQLSEIIFGKHNLIAGERANDDSLRKLYFRMQKYHFLLRVFHFPGKKL